jgi:hypothetical protein
MQYPVPTKWTLTFCTMLIVYYVVVMGGSI